MPYLDDVALGAVDGDPDAAIRSVVKQVNEWARTLSNEKRADVYKDNTGINRIIIGVLPDGDSGIVVSKEGIDVLDVFD